MQIVLYDPRGKYNYSERWAGQFLEPDPGNRRRFKVDGATPSAIVDQIRLAAQAAHGGGTVIFGLGHGGTTDASQGFADLAPNNQFRLGRTFTGKNYVDVFYDTDFDAGTTVGGSLMARDVAVWDEVDGFDSDKGKAKLRAKFKMNPQLIPNYIREQKAKKQQAVTRRGRWLNYKAVGYALRDNGVDLAVLMTCNVGNSDLFIRKIANDWKIKVRAYRKYLWFGGTPNGKRVRVYLDGDPGGYEPSQETDPPGDPGYFYTAGPSFGP